LILPYLVCRRENCENRFLKQGLKEDYSTKNGARCELCMKVGLIGCGRVAHIHMSAYKAIGKVNVVAVADADVNRAKAFAQPYGINQVFSNYSDLFEVKDLDFVDVCTPTSTHEVIVRDAAKAGLSVLMEKPMGRNSEECERMVEESRKHGTRICVCHNQLFFPYIRRLKSIADSEGFNLISFRTFHRENFEWLKAHGLAQPWNVSPEHGGILWEVGCHQAYLQLHFLKDIEEVYALGVKAKHPVWDDFTVILRTSSKRRGIMEISWIAQEPEMVYEVIGSNGRRVQAFLFHGYIIDRTQKPLGGAVDVTRSFFSDEKRLLVKWTKFARDQIKKPESGHIGLISSYVESLEKGASPPVTGEDGRNAVKLLECIEESLKEQKPVKYSSW
jgi:UDP-N-acetyl-2-amino-2-deoxyglucuronate dehydrogenase